MPIRADWVRALWRDRRGVTALEYGLLAGLIAVAIIGSITALGRNLSDVFSTAAVRL